MRAVLFDLDGTLLDTTEGILESVSYAAKEMGYPELPFNTKLKFVGPPIQNSFMTFYGCTAEQAQKAANIFRDYYKNHALFKARLYDGVPALLERLRQKNIKIAVATYKREDYALTILDHFGISTYCDAIHGADNNNRLSKADIVEMCIHELNVPSKDVVLVGDTEHDALGAQKAKIAFIGVTYGFGFKKKEDVEIFCNVGFVDKPMDIMEKV